MSVVDEVRERTDILALVGASTPLRKAGRLYKGLCPFHNEDTPSFVVYPDSGRWHCFGACATGGDVFGFVMRRDGVGFREALELLAHQAGMVLAQATPEADARKAERDRWRETLAAAAAFYHEQLLKAPAAEAARTYLKSRDFHRDAAEAFELGWAPEAAQATRQALRGAGFTDEEMLAVGVLRKRDDGGLYGAYRGRLVFPIRDGLGRPAGFGARTLVAGEVPKYINSPQSDLFDKSHLLYGLDRARSAIHAAGRAVVVEGYTDVIRAHMGGFVNVVASLGTALTEMHVRTLCRHTRTIVLALDADAAGQAATLRGLDVAAAAAGDVTPVPTAEGLIRYEQVADVRLHVAVLPEGLDPDDVVRDDPAAWERLIAEASPMMEYLFDTLTAGLDLTRPSDRTVAVERLAPIVASIGDPVASAAWLDELAQRTGIDRRAIAARSVQLADSRPNTPLRRAAPGAPPPAVEAQRDTSTWLLGRLVVDPGLVGRVNERLRAVGLAELCGDDWCRGIDREVFSSVCRRTCPTARRRPGEGADGDRRRDREAEGGPAGGPENEVRGEGGQGLGDGPTARGRQGDTEAAGGGDALGLGPEVEAHEQVLRERAEREPALAADAELPAVQSAVLRIREAAVRQGLSSLKALIEAGDGDGEERAVLEARSRGLAQELRRLQALLHPPGARARGKTDGWLR